jgi:hypothetical protein
VCNLAYFGATQRRYQLEDQGSKTNGMKGKERKGKKGEERRRKRRVLHY